MDVPSISPVRRTAISSYHDIALRQAKSMLCEKDASVHSQTMKSIKALLNFLAVNEDALTFQGFAVRKFERLTLEQLPNLSDDSVLHRVLRTAGWVGTRYQFSSECPVDVVPMKQMLATLYLSRASANNTAFDLHDDDNVIKSFCPDALFRYFGGNPTSDGMVGNDNESLVGEGHRCVSFFGTCMLVDISGFTKLSAALCTKGSAGLDDLHLAISGYLGRCVEIVYAHGGDVISFAGDALICVFSNRDGWSRSTEFADTEDGTRVPLTGDGRTSPDSQAPGSFPNALAAVRCAMELKEHCTDTLTAHIAVSCGEMSFAMLGGHNKEYIYMVVGGCINEIATCIDDAKSKQVVVTPLVAEWLAKELPSKSASTGEPFAVNSEVLEHSGNVRIDEIVGEFTRPEDVNRLEMNTCSVSEMRRLRKFTPLPVLHSLMTKSFQVSSQLREVTTIFLKLDSFDASAIAESVPLLQKFFLMAQKILADTGGFMRQFLVDDKGCVLIAMWGVPSFTHPNNCTRALHASGRLAQQTRAMNHRCSMGITTGHVYCGTVGSVTRRDYVGIGSTVNMSARLMGKAKGRILLDEDTHDRLPVDSRYLLREIQPLQLKGIDGDVRAFESSPAFAEATSSALDSDDSNGQVLRMQRDVVKALCARLNELVCCVKDRHLESGLGAALPVVQEQSMEKQGRMSISSSGVESNANMSNSAKGRLGGLSLPGSRGDESHSGHVAAASRSQSVSGESSNAAAMALLVSGLPFNGASVTPADAGAKSPIYPLGIRDDISPMVTYTVIQGPVGSGKSTCADNFRRGAQSRGLRCIQIKAQRRGQQHVYELVGKLLTELIGPDELNSERRQKVALQRLVNRLFPEADAITLLRRSRTLKAALGYKWLTAGADLHANQTLFNAQDPNSASHTVSMVAKSSTLKSSSVSMFWKQDSARGLRSPSVSGNESTLMGRLSTQANYARPGARLGESASWNLSAQLLKIQSTGDGSATNEGSSSYTIKQHGHNSESSSGDHLLTKLLVLLLQGTPTAIAIDDAHNADEFSWMILRQLLDLPVQVSFVLTILSQPLKDELPVECSINRMDDLQTSMGASVKVVATSGAAKSSRNMLYGTNSSVRAIQDHARCSTFDMQPLGYAEVHYLITNTLLDDRKRAMELKIKSGYAAASSRAFSAKEAPSSSEPTPTKNRSEREPEPGLSAAASMTSIARGALNAITSTVSQPKIENASSSSSTPRATSTTSIAPPVAAARCEAITPAVVEAVLRVSNGNAFWCRAVADFILERGVSDFMKYVDQANEIEDAVDGPMSPAFMATERPTVHGNFSMNSGHATPAGTGSRHVPGSTPSIGSARVVAGSNNWNPNGIFSSMSSGNATPAGTGSRHAPGSTPPIGSARVAAGANNRNPLNVLVVCRLERLPHKLQTIIKHAAIIGHEFSFTTLRAVLPAEYVGKLERSIEILLESSFILCTGVLENDSECYCFQNYLMRNAIYDLMPPSAAAKIHELVAEHIEHMNANNITRVLSSLCYHYALAPARGSDAIRYAAMGADECVSRGALRDAVYFFQRAAIIVDQAPALDPLEIRRVIAMIQFVIRLINPDGLFLSVMRKLNIWRPLNVDQLANKMELLSSNFSADQTADLIPIYVALKTQIEAKLGEIHAHGGGSSRTTSTGFFGGMLCCSSCGSDSVVPIESQAAPGMN